MPIFNGYNIICNEANDKIMSKCVGAKRVKMTIKERLNDFPKNIFKRSKFEAVYEPSSEIIVCESAKTIVMHSSIMDRFTRTDNLINKSIKAGHHNDAQSMLDVMRRVNETSNNS